MGKSNLKRELGVNSQKTAVRRKSVTCEHMYIKESGHLS